MTLTPAPDLPAVAPEATRLPRLSSQPAYRRWWAADTSALLAGGIYQFALPLLLLAATGSPAQAGALAALGLLARTSLTMAGGAMADRAERTRMIVLGGLTGAALSGALAVAAWTGTLGALLLCVAHVLMELRSGYFSSASNAALKDAVHPGQLGRAMAANQGRDATLTLASAPLAGMLLSFGAGLTLLLVSVLQLISAVAGRMLAAPLRSARSMPGASKQPAERIAGGVLPGMRWCFARPQLRTLLLLIVVVNLGTNGIATTLIYGLQQRGEAPWVIGLVSTCMGVGMLLGSLLATGLIDRFRTGPLTCLCLTTLGLGSLLMGFGSSLWWMGAMLALSFLSVPALNAGAGGYFMAVIPAEMAGRASALVTFMALSALPLAPLCAGIGIQWLGMGPTLIFFGTLVMLAALGAWCSPLIRGIPGTGQWNEVQLATTADKRQRSAEAPVDANAGDGSRGTGAARGGKRLARAHHGRFPDPYGQQPHTTHRPLPPTEQWNYL
ncbi:MFS transporter [Glutamicibacter sp. AOP12-B1-11]|uniref:MFS transporter n=1 Tax=Glutamicibacter sp. AOP12-B1-11 TaxID=3457725 RepID=UPI0040338F75